MFCSWSVPVAAAARVLFVHLRPVPRLTPASGRHPNRAFPLPPGQSGCLHARPFSQPARADDITKVQSSSIAKHNPPLSLPALSSSLGLFRGPALRRSYRRRLCPADDQAGHTSRLNHQDAAEPPHAISPDSLHVTPAGASTARPSHAPAPPYHPTVRTRRRITIMTPGRPAAVTPRHRQIAQTNTGRRGAPTFALASLDLARCLRRPTEVAGPPMP